MKPLVVLSVFGGLALGSCARRPVYVRFKNDSPETFVRMQANLMGQVFAFDSLWPGQLTRTVAVDDTYDYCWLQVVTANDTLLFRPIDYVGEKLYRSG
ncbi:hypothetical protein [Hymenobacter edaphi]|uniref:hypothetical protein n=1 Tax=Hymenobacter edaphi TaxID=2211146 RepID=UPI001057DB9D|nr:hypothetical protein [Hymenobacter edaphi]